MKLYDVKRHGRYWEDPISTKEISFSAWQLVYLPIKRLLDILFSAMFLVLSSPISLVFIILILLEKDGPVFFRQQRVGKNGKLITIYKFRTMSSKAPTEISSAEFTDSDMYITKIGRFLRKTSIDEFPQFINVLKGDMSIVGPRPLIVNEKDIHAMRMKKGIYAVKPGLTGYAQINGRDLLTPLQKVKYDEYYLNHFGLSIDANILMRSFIIVLTHKGFIEGHQQTKIYRKQDADPVIHAEAATVYTIENYNIETPTLITEKVKSVV